MKLKKLLGAAAISMLTLAGTQVHAGVMAAANLNISQLLIVNSTTAPLPHTPYTGGQIAILQDSRTGVAGSDYNGVDGVGVGNSSITKIFPDLANDPLDQRIVDVQHRCAGPSCGVVNGAAGPYAGVAENNKTTHFTTNVGNFALGDMDISGNALIGAGASGLTRADASADGGHNLGGSNATITNIVNTFTTFTVQTPGNIAFLLSYDAYTAAYISPDVALLRGNASATMSFKLNVTDESGATVLSWAPTELNSIDRSRISAGFSTGGSNGTIFSPDLFLNTGGIYTLSITQETHATVRQIPEPGSLMLVGLGLFGLAAASRRRLQK